MPDRPPSPPAGLDDVRRAADAHVRRLHQRGDRKRLGAFYTPGPLAAGLVDLALTAHGPLGDRSPEALRVIDPACGAGELLVTAGEQIAVHLVGRGWVAGEARAAVARRALHGIDVDPTAAQLAREALAAFGGVPVADVAEAIQVGDALARTDLVPPGSFDLVVGNPPFLNQLGSATARAAEDRSRLRARFGPALGAYTDPAAAFLLLGLELARPDRGVVALVEPVSLLSSRDGAGVRAAVLEAGALHDLWLVGDGGFDAVVEVCVPVVVRGARPAPVRVHHGAGCEPAGEQPVPQGPSWSALVAELHGLPAVPAGLAVGGRLGDLAEATADFRDQYYGLVPHVVDRADGPDDRWPPLVTSGLIDPLSLAWGERSARFAKVRHDHPRVDRAALPPKLAAWADARLVPKVVVATQTRVIEAVADPGGRLLPSVPVLTVRPRSGTADDVWPILAVLASPVASLVAARQLLGSGRSLGALRVRAADVVGLPTPAHPDPWHAAADVLRAASPPGVDPDSTPAPSAAVLTALEQAADLMDAAYGLAPAEAAPVRAWWRANLPASLRPPPTA